MPKDLSYILNGEAHGEVGEQLFSTGHDDLRFDPGLARPYRGDDGRVYCDVQTGRIVRNSQGKRTMEVKVIRASDLIAEGLLQPTVNATTMRKDDWIEMDRAVQGAVRQRLRVWADFRAANTYGGFDGMKKSTIEYEATNDPGEAMQDMDGLGENRQDSFLFKLRSMPLPITHSGFSFSKRRMQTSGGFQLDTSAAEAAGRRIAEKIEKQVIGVDAGLLYGPDPSVDTRYDSGLNSKVYGMTNYPYRLTKTDLNTPTGSNPEAVKQDVIEMREALYAQGFYGPFMLYHTPAYDAFLDDDYFRSGGTSANRTLRERIAEIDGISGIRRLDFWTGATYQMVLIQMTNDVARAVVGMEITTLNWESHGGLKKNWKVMTIQAPQLKADYNGKCGLLHATTS